jgi:FtsP/CotA-like multicopper oxidase with cupredoxin domain
VFDRRLRIAASIGALALFACSEERLDPVPGVWGTTKIEDTNPDPRVVEFSLTAKETEISLFGHPLRMMTYEGLFPGPLIEVNAGDEIIAHFRNELPEATTIHWHGLRVPDAMDGNPRIQTPVPPGGTFEYRFIVRDDGSYWYHPHHRAHEQLEKGLYAPLVVRRPEDPKYHRERYLLLDDLTIDPNTGDFPPTLIEMMELVHGRMGKMFLTNGKPSEEVIDTADQGTIERWRIVNASNARTMKLSLRGASFRVIATDGGLLREPYTTDSLIVAVGQRYDLEVSYASAGRAELISHQLEVIMGEIVEVAQVRVFAADIRPSDRPLPVITWPVLPVPPAREVGREVTFEIDAAMSADSGVEWRINGVAHRHEPIFTFTKGDTVKMRIVNLKNPEHPFHLHGQFFEIPGGNEPGLKDTVLVPGKSTVEITAYLDNPGRWMTHCHILEHVELGMVSEILVEDR